MSSKARFARLKDVSHTVSAPRSQSSPSNTIFSSNMLNRKYCANMVVIFPAWTYTDNSAFYNCEILYKDTYMRHACGSYNRVLEA